MIDQQVTDKLQNNKHDGTTKGRSKAVRNQQASGKQNNDELGNNKIVSNNQVNNQTVRSKH